MIMIVVMVMIVAMILLVTPLPIVLLIVLIESAVVTIRVAVVLGRPLPVVAFLSITPVVIVVVVRIVNLVVMLRTAGCQDRGNESHSQGKCCEPSGVKAHAFLLRKTFLLVAEGWKYVAQFTALPNQPGKNSRQSWTRSKATDQK